MSRENRLLTKQLFFILLGTLLYTLVFIYQLNLPLNSDDAHHLKFGISLAEGAHDMPKSLEDARVNHHGLRLGLLAPVALIYLLTGSKFLAYYLPTYLFGVSLVVFSLYYFRRYGSFVYGFLFILLFSTYPLLNSASSNLLADIPSAAAMLLSIFLFSRYFDLEGRLAHLCLAGALGLAYLSYLIRLNNIVYLFVSLSIIVIQKKYRRKAIIALSLLILVVAVEQGVTSLFGYAPFVRVQIIKDALDNYSPHLPVFREVSDFIFRYFTGIFQRAGLLYVIIESVFIISLILAFLSKKLFLRLMSGAGILNLLSIFSIYNISNGVIHAATPSYIPRYFSLYYLASFFAVIYFASRGANLLLERFRQGRSRDNASIALLVVSVMAIVLVAFVFMDNSSSLRIFNSSGENLKMLNKVKELRADNGPIGITPKSLRGLDIYEGSPFIAENTFEVSSLDTMAEAVASTKYQYLLFDRREYIKYIKYRKQRSSDTNSDYASIYNSLKENYTIIAESQIYQLYEDVDSAIEKYVSIVEPRHSEGYSWPLENLAVERAENEIVLSAAKDSWLMCSLPAEAKGRFMVEIKMTEAVADTVLLIKHRTGNKTGPVDRSRHKGNIIRRLLIKDNPGEEVSIAFKIRAGLEYHIEHIKIGRLK